MSPVDDLTALSADGSGGEPHLAVEPRALGEPSAPHRSSETALLTNPAVDRGCFDDLVGIAAHESSDGAPDAHELEGNL